MSMKLPKLYEWSNSRDMISEFGGYHHDQVINVNEFYEMQNLSSDEYPILSARKQRGKVRALTSPNGLFSHGKLCWVDGTSFYYDGSEITGFSLANSKKKFVGMGAYILIWPDKKYYNAADGSFGGLGNIQSSSAVTATLCKVDGAEYTNYSVSETAPSSPSDGQLWIDSSSSPHVLRQYSASYGSWSSVPTVFVKLSATGIGIGFSEGDGVSISGMTDNSLNGDFVLVGAGEDYIIITAIIDASISQSNEAIVERKIPDLDYITQSENRVWGCSSAKREVYACKLGDPKNWYCYQGLSTDSYAMTVGSPGDFTGCCTHLGYVIFFKEDVIHKIYGSRPANYQLTNINCRGVQKGSEGSLAAVNEVLFYKSPNDVCAYQASLPTSVSDALGSEKYSNAVCGTYESKYYFCAEDNSGAYKLLVYDTKRSIWHCEDNVNVLAFASYNNDLYFIDGSDNCIYSANGNITDYSDANASLESPIAWEAISGAIGLEYPDHKYVSKIQFRLSLPSGSTVKVFVSYDGASEWSEKYSLCAETLRSYCIPVIPRRCDTMKIKLSGTGKFFLYSMTKTIEQGSEL